MTICFTELHPTFGAEVHNLEIRQPLQPAEINSIQDGMDQYGLLLIRGQPLTPDQQMSFTRQFGPLDLGFRRVKTAPGGETAHRFAHAELADISNIDSCNALAARNSKKIISNIANQMWHSDSSFQRPRAKYSMLHAVTVTQTGGNTEFADQRNAWDRLPPALKQKIESLRVEHFALHSRFALGDTDYTQDQLDAIAPVSWPLVQKHPGSGRKHLFIGAHARDIESMETAEARMLLWDLLELATDREYVYVHQWQPGDLVIWDNGCLLHRGRAFDLSERRELRRSTTLDELSAQDAAIT
ncbi:MAG: TauD/TfdA dioxygenase family protein [Burkholderiaceae bacterium]